ncbi:MAG: hypothetical protein ABR505_03185 [Actinomycetota bacterium]
MKQQVRIASVGIALMLVACSSQFSDQLRANFIGACEQTSGGATGTCTCILEGLEDRMSEEEYRDLEAQGESSLLADSRVREAIEECR